MTSSIRLHVAADLAAGAAVPATAAQAHYLRAVMRRAVGDRVLLFNGRDGEWAAVIATFGRDGAGLVAERRTRVQAAEPDLWLLFAPLKRDATDLVARQATELGVAALHPVLTAHTNAERVNVTRMAAIAAEAAEQCERLTVPSVAAPVRLATVLAQWPAGQTPMGQTPVGQMPVGQMPVGQMPVGQTPAGQTPMGQTPVGQMPVGRTPVGQMPVGRTLFVALERHQPTEGDGLGDGSPVASAVGRPAALLIGPEGGFAPEERAALLRHPAVRALPLGPRVLRAETAVVAGLAILLIRHRAAGDPAP